MRKRVYEFPSDKSRVRERDELAAAIREITPSAKTIAEEACRRQIIRMCRIIARREVRDAERGPKQP
jgi:hypothetical protein